MDKITGILPRRGTTRATKQPFEFYEVTVFSPDVVSGQIGQPARVMICNDVDLCNEIGFRLSEVLRNGGDFLPAKKIISHYNNGRNVLDYVVFSDEEVK